MPDEEPVPVTRTFTRELAALGAGPESWKGRRFVFVPYDQLSGEIGPLAHEPPAQLGIVLVENPWKAARRPYHKQKLALVLANLRHFALEQARRGVAVAHLVHDGPYRDALRPFAERCGVLRVMEPAERELRADLAPLVAAGLMEVLPHEGWLTTRLQFERSQGRAPPWRMDDFYRHVRREQGVLMEGTRPRGGRWSFDALNRKRWRGRPPAPTPPRFEPDAITQEVGALIERHFAHHPGTLDLGALPATAADAERFADWALDECLDAFGPLEDAMSTASSGLFHTRLSPLLNLHRLLPRDLLRRVLAAPIALESQEGFVRQLLGWREYMHHVHALTDGFRALPEGHELPPIAAVPGDGGFARWSGSPWQRGTDVPDADGGACPSALNADTPLPPALWGRPSGMACLDHVIEGVWREAWSHHITRLMIVANIATLLDVSPRELTDWFWVAYQDAYDWVVEPNVLGMGSFAMRDLFMTKPYISGAAYIDRMSDYCGGCAFDPKRNCPITPMYWAFLERKRPLLEGNPRLEMPLKAAASRDARTRAADRRVFEAVRSLLVAGERLTPQKLLVALEPV
ncbi:MAG: cryptochrome/photolyase family protein [Methylibium sp.]|uniref:cryptochrome/photolyase family protein n=1 Tax=Methylibium sp. TaxID=2067992 RepID=UPI0017C98D81|nr:cryptochrome/photolyase family protein [Methylibium sp.]MBA3596923.1 cryptochrome/photolyase family protein [Methylibium sp.]